MKRFISICLSVSVRQWMLTDSVYARVCVPGRVEAVLISNSTHFCMLNIKWHHTRRRVLLIWWLASCWATHLMSDVVGPTYPKLGLSRIKIISTLPTTIYEYWIMQLSGDTCIRFKFLNMVYEKGEYRNISSVDRKQM